MTPQTQLPENPRVLPPPGETSNGHTFKAGKIVFVSIWVGDASGYYVWRSKCHRYAVRKLFDGYAAKCGGKLDPRTFRSLKEAMNMCAYTPIQQTRWAV